MFAPNLAAVQQLKHITKNCKFQLHEWFKGKVSGLSMSVEYISWEKATKMFRRPNLRAEAHQSSNPVSMKFNIPLPPKKTPDVWTEPQSHDPWVNPCATSSKKTETNIYSLKHTHTHTDTHKLLEALHSQVVNDKLKAMIFPQRRELFILASCTEEILKARG